jgi:phosphatidylglycerol:prolipoprotein diacylglycerol transferase
VHDIAFQLGPITVTWYGILVASGFLFGLWNASRRAARQNIAPEAIFDCGTWLLVGAIVGARTVYVFSYWPDILRTANEYQHSRWVEIFMVQHGGIVYYGGLIGASAAGALFAWRKKLPVWKLADILAPGVALGSFVGRWGCLMHGCCYGRPTDLPWGIQFPVGHPSHPDDGLPHYVHPTEIYDSLLNLALFAGLAWFYKRRKFDGQVFALYLVCYAVLRSIVECFRGDYPPADLAWGRVTPAQLVSVGTLLAGVLLQAKSREEGNPRIKDVKRIPSRHFRRAFFILHPRSKPRLSGRTHRGRQVRAGAGPGGTDRRRNHFRGFHASLPGNGHRHGQTGTGGVAARAPPFN